MRVFERIIVDLAKHRAAKQLKADGYKDSEGKHVKLDTYNASRLVGKVDDEAIAQHVADEGVVAAAGDPAAPGFLKRLIDWLASAEGQAKLLSIVKFIVSIAAMFGL